MIDTLRFSYTRVASMKRLAKYRESLYQQLFRTVPVPEDLASVTDIDTSAEVDPQQAGLDPASVDVIWEACLYC
jgi:hypothetical protein